MKKMIYPIIAVLIIACDQLSKYAVRSSMQPGERIEILGRWFSICYVRNTGAAFSMFQGNRFVTVILTSLLIVGCIGYAVKLAGQGKKLFPLLLTCIAAGGVSNMIDRLTLGFVTDMISCGSFAIFNLADIFITCGCILMMIAVLFMFKNGEEL